MPKKEKKEPKNKKSSKPEKSPVRNKKKKISANASNKKGFSKRSRKKSKVQEVSPKNEKLSIKFESSPLSAIKAVRIMQISYLSYLIKENARLYEIKENGNSKLSIKVTYDDEEYGIPKIADAYDMISILNFKKFDKISIKTDRGRVNITANGIIETYKSGTTPFSSKAILEKISNVVKFPLPFVVDLRPQADWMWQKITSSFYDLILILGNTFMSDCEGGYCVACCDSGVCYDIFSELEYDNIDPDEVITYIILKNYTKSVAPRILIDIENRTIFFYTDNEHDKTLLSEIVKEFTS